MNEEHRLLQASLARFFTERWVPRAAGWRRAGLMERDTWREAGAHGLLCAAIPEAWGGGGGDFGHEVAIIVMAAGAEPDLAGGFGGNSVHSAASSRTTSCVMAPRHNAQRWLPQDGHRRDASAAIAMTEPGTGTDLQAVQHQRANGMATTTSSTAQKILHHQRLPRRPDRASSAAPAPRGRRQGPVSLVMAEVARVGHGLNPPRAAAGQDRPAYGPGHLRAVLRGHARALQPTCWACDEGQGLPPADGRSCRSERLIIAVQAASSTHAAGASRRPLAYVMQRRDLRPDHLMQMQNTRFKLAECAERPGHHRAHASSTTAIGKAILRGELDNPTVRRCCQVPGCSETVGKVPRPTPACSSSAATAT